SEPQSTHESACDSNPERVASSTSRSKRSARCSANSSQRTLLVIGSAPPARDDERGGAEPLLLPSSRAASRQFPHVCNLPRHAARTPVAHPAAAFQSLARGRADRRVAMACQLSPTCYSTTLNPRRRSHPPNPRIATVFVL